MMLHFDTAHAQSHLSLHRSHVSLAPSIIPGICIENTTVRNSFLIVRKLDVYVFFIDFLIVLIKYLTRFYSSPSCTMTKSHALAILSITISS